MFKSYMQYLSESVQERTGEITMASLNGGINAVSISLPTQRNPEKTGEIKLELFTKGPQTYKFTPTGDLKAQMDIITSFAGAADETDKTALEIIEKEVKNLKAEITSDLLQLFTKLDEDIKTVLKKHGIQ